MSHEPIGFGPYKPNNFSKTTKKRQNILGHVFGIRVYKKHTSLYPHDIRNRCAYRGIGQRPITQYAPIKIMSYIAISALYLYILAYMAGFCGYKSQNFKNYKKKAC